MKLWKDNILRNAEGKFCQTPVLGLGLGVDFTFAWDNNNNKNDKNSHLNFLKETVLGDKGQGSRDNGQGSRVKW